MNEWLLSLVGTPEGARLATLLALTAALAHAVFGALQKGAHDPWLSRGSIDLALVIMSAPVAILWFGPPPVHMWPVLAGVVVIHFAYKLAMALAYEKAAFTVVYPVVRGTGPLITVIAAMLFFGEDYTALQWLGVACLSGGILLLALRNLSEEQIDLRALKIGLVWALVGGVLVAVYTTYDAWAIRISGEPLAFLAWFFFLSSVDFMILGLLRYRKMAQRPAPLPLLMRGVAGGLIAYVSFGAVMIATLIGKVGEAAVLRETSTVFAALIGWFILKERVGPRKLALMCLIAAGAVIMELGRAS
ncbi:MAG: multidrug transporter [Rhodobacteraceae bacterium]|nr:MAG: multidrug transporter [Paracoccaceae bacterium]